jgi:hypothetical protein
MRERGEASDSPDEERSNDLPEKILHSQLCTVGLDGSILDGVCRGVQFGYEMTIKADFPVNHSVQAKAASVRTWELVFRKTNCSGSGDGGAFRSDRHRELGISEGGVNLERRDVRWTHSFQRKLNFEKRSIEGFPGGQASDEHPSANRRSLLPTARRQHQ